MRTDARGGSVEPRAGSTAEGAQSFLNWLDDPSDSAGIHAFEAGKWRFHSYAGIAAQARTLASLIAEHEGGGRAPRVAIISEHAPTVLAGFGAAWLLGGAAHLLPQPFTFRKWKDYLAQIEFMIGLAQGGHLVFGQDSAAVVDRLSPGLAGSVRLHRVSWDVTARASAAARPDRPPRSGWNDDDAALHQFTSGSTGPPKLIEVSAANLSANLESMRRWLEWLPGRDGWASWLPLHHDMGLVGALFMPAANGSHLWSMSPAEFLRQPSAWLASLSAGKATVTAAPPFGYAYAAQRAGDLPAGTDLRQWRVACIAAEVISEEVLALFAGRFAGDGFRYQTWCPAYGLAEATLCVTAVSAGEPVRIARLEEGAVLRHGGPVPVARVDEAGGLTTRAGRGLIGCGRPVSGMSVDIVDEQGRFLPDGHFGEIVVRGPSVATIRASAADPSRAGQRARAHFTGDGGIRLDGELFVVGRLGDGIKVRGEFVDCEDLERRLARALGVSAGRVALALGQIGVETRALLLVRAEQPDEAAIARAERIFRSAAGPDARLLVRLVASGEIPKTSSGKVKRREIWRLWGQLVQEQQEPAGKATGVGDERAYDPA